MMDAKPTFEPLDKLFRGDHDKMRRALGIFQHTTRSDLEQLDQAFAGHDLATIGRLMHKMKSGCMQLGEDAAADAILAVESMLCSGPEGEALARAFAMARDELDRVQARVVEYLSTEDGTGEA